MIVLTTAGILRERMKQVLGLVVVVAQILGTVTGKAKWYLIETGDETGPGYGTGVPDKGERPVLPPSILPDNYNLESEGDETGEDANPDSSDKTTDGVPDSAFGPAKD